MCRNPYGGHGGPPHLWLIPSSVIAVHPQPNSTAGLRVRQATPAVGRASVPAKPDSRWGGPPCPSGHCGYSWLSNRLHALRQVPDGHAARARFPNAELAAQALPERDLLGGDGG